MRSLRHLNGVSRVGLGTQLRSAAAVQGREGSSRAWEHKADSGGQEKDSSEGDGSWWRRGAGLGGAAGVALAFGLPFALKGEGEYVRSEPMPVHSEEEKKLTYLETSLQIWEQAKDIPEISPTRVVATPEGQASGLRLRLYQYQSCPFCSKLRAFLDYYGFSYELVEVNSVTRTQVKWNSKSRKVPMLLVLDAPNGEALQIPDSSFQVTVLRSLMGQGTAEVEKVLRNYALLRETVEEGSTDWLGRPKTKDVVRCPNKYFVMRGEGVKGYSEIESVKEEREWRMWVDRVFVHVISPNVYRTPSESLETFRWFSDFGEWEQNWGWWERQAALYVGSAAMYLIAKRLKKRYALKDDVRQSLYDAGRTWTKALQGRPFMGGQRPNLADLVSPLFLA